MKILISLIGMDKQVRSSVAASIKRLLSAACQDKDEVLVLSCPHLTTLQWVPVIAGLVHGKVFPVSDPMIQSRTDKIIQETAQKIIDELPTEIQEDKVSDFLHYQPFEDSFFTPNTTDTAHDQNPHFSYTSTGPNFFERELRVMEERKAKEQSLVAKRSPQVTVSSTVFGSTGPQNRSTTLSSGLRSMLQTEPKKSAKTISDAKVLPLLPPSLLLSPYS
jgi:hypothetical protein